MHILDTPPEDVFDHLTQLAAETLKVPIVLVSLIDEERQWFKSRHGLAASETPRNVSFCGHAIHGAETFVVADAHQDSRFADNPFVTGDPHIRFYAGHPLASRDGYRVGTLCCIDQKAKQFSATERDTLRAFAKIAEHILRTREVSMSAAESTAKHPLSERMLRCIANNLPAVIGFWDLDLRCRFANDAYLEWFGQTSQAMIGKFMPDVLGKVLFAKNEPFIRGALAGAPQTFERVITKPSRQLGYTQTSYIPLCIDDRIIGFSVLIYDVTQLKLTEQALSLANERSAKAQAEAESANRSKGEFLANVSHEIRTPLAGIVGMTDLILAGALGPEERKYGEILKSSGQHLMGLIKNTLDLSRIESGNMVLEDHEFDVHTLMRDQANIFYAEFHRKGIGLTLHIDPQVAPRWRGDSARLSQMLINYLNNAIKFTESGAITLRCEVSKQLGPRSLLRFSVQDTGIGIAPEMMTRLFVAFSQADGSITRRYGGTGLGLSICKQLATLMGGDVGAESVEGQGSTFWLTVNLQPITTAQPSTIAALDEQLADARPLPSSREILVVDDNAVNRLIVVSQLKTLGYSCHCVNNGHEALTQWSKQPWDLILMDCQMPCMDGYEAAKQIRSKELHTGNHVPIVAPDRQRHARRPSQMHRRRHGRLYSQARRKIAVRRRAKTLAQA